MSRHVIVLLIPTDYEPASEGADRDEPCNRALVRVHLYVRVHRQNGSLLPPDAAKVRLRSVDPASEFSAPKLRYITSIG